jgi:hypothetical protein
MLHHSEVALLTKDQELLLIKEVLHHEVAEAHMVDLQDLLIKDLAEAVAIQEVRGLEVAVVILEAQEVLEAEVLEAVVPEVEAEEGINSRTIIISHISLIISV